MTQIMEAPKKGVVNCGVKSALFVGERGKSCCVSGVYPACRGPQGRLVQWACHLSNRAPGLSTHWPLDWLTGQLPGRPVLDNTGGPAAGRSLGGDLQVYSLLEVAETEPLQHGTGSVRTCWLELLGWQVLSQSRAEFLRGLGFKARP